MTEVLFLFIPKGERCWIAKMARSKAFFYRFPRSSFKSYFSGWDCWCTAQYKRRWEIDVGCSLPKACNFGRVTWDCHSRITVANKDRAEQWIRRVWTPQTKEDFEEQVVEDKKLWVKYLLYMLKRRRVGAKTLDCSMMKEVGKSG